MEASDIITGLILSSNVNDLSEIDDAVQSATANKDENCLDSNGQGARNICCSDEEEPAFTKSDSSDGDNVDQDIATPDDNLKPTEGVDSSESNVKDLSLSKNENNEKIYDLIYEQQVVDIQESEKVPSINAMTESEIEQTNNANVKVVIEKLSTNGSEMKSERKDADTPVNEVPGKGDNKTKSKTKLTSKTKGKERSNKFLIDDQVLNEVKNLIKAVESKCDENKTDDVTQQPQEKLDRTGKVKEKKKKKSKRSNSKNCESSPIESSAEKFEDPSSDKRIILKRGTVWKHVKKDSSFVSPDSPEDFRKCTEDDVSDDVAENMHSMSSNSVNVTNGIKQEEKIDNDHLEEVINEAADILIPDETETAGGDRNFADHTDFLREQSKTEITLNEIPSSEETVRGLHDVTVFTLEENDVASHDKLVVNSIPEISVIDNITVEEKFTDLLREQSRAEITVDEILSSEATVKGLYNVTVCTLKENAVASHDKLVNPIPEIFVTDNINVEGKFSFNSEISVVKLLHPSIEFLSDSSSSSSTSSINTEKLGCGEVLAHKQSEDSQSDFFVPLLFDDKLFSKLDGLKNLKFRNRKRHSLPKVTPLHQVIEDASSYYSNSCHDIKSLYENAGETLYAESCHCSENEIMNQMEVWSGSNEARSNESQSDNDGEVVNSDTGHENIEDSDETGDTWHHKNIKEKIKKIIGVRLKQNFEPHESRTSDHPMKLGSHLCSSSDSALPLENGETSKGVKLKNQVKNNTKLDGRLTGTYVGRKELREKRQEGSSSKASHNLRHMNLTFLTDSDQDRKSSPETVNVTPPEDIVDRWGNVQTKALERQQQSAQFRQLQRQIKSIRLNMEGILSRCSSLALVHTLENLSQISQKVEEVKGLLTETESLRTDLSSLNIIVHRFTSEMGPTFTPLKDEMAELYRLWDETHRRVNGELSHLQNVSATCRLWEEQKTDLSKALKQDSDTLKVIDAAIDSGTCTESVSASVQDVAKLLNERRKLPSGGKSRSQGLMSEKFELGKLGNEKRDDRLSDSGTSGYESCSSDDLSERERRLAYLRRLARDLQSSLAPGSIAWNEVHQTLDQAEIELKELQDHCRTLITKTAAGTLEPNSKAPRFSSNCKRRNWVREGKSSRSSRIERRAKVGGSRRGEWAWRVARAAVPFQVALMLLLCVACLLEPNCCDSVNTFNLSFSPQLRFVHGSPPV